MSTLPANLVSSVNTRAIANEYTADLKPLTCAEETRGYLHEFCDSLRSVNIAVSFNPTQAALCSAQRSKGRLSAEKSCNIF